MWQRRTHGGLALVVIDYLQLLKVHHLKKASELDRLTYITKTLKQAAMELDVPLIAAAQLNREALNNNQDPKLSHLRGSGTIEQDADVVVLLQKQNPKTEKPDVNALDLYKVNVAKNRGGPTGVGFARFKPGTTTFYPYERKNQA